MNKQMIQSIALDQELRTGSPIRNFDQDLQKNVYKRRGKTTCIIHYRVG